MTAGLIFIPKTFLFIWFIFISDIIPRQGCSFEFALPLSIQIWVDDDFFLILGKWRVGVSNTIYRDAPSRPHMDASLTCLGF